MERNLGFSRLLLDSLMCLLSSGGYFHVYRKKGTKLVFRILSVIYSLLILSVVTIFIVLEAIGSQLSPKPVNYTLLVALSNIISNFYASIILLGNFIQSFDKMGYYNLVEKVIMSTVYVKISCKILIFVMALTQLAMLGLILPDVHSVMTGSENDIRYNLKIYHSYTNENISYGYFIHYLFIFRNYVMSTFLPTLALFLVESICILLSNQFILCTEKLNKMTLDNTHELEVVIREYERLRKIVNQTDKLFMVLIGVMLSIGIFSTCLYGYMLIVTGETSTIRYVLYPMMYIFLVCVSGAYLNACVSIIWA